MQRFIDGLEVHGRMHGREVVASIRALALAAALVLPLALAACQQQELFPDMVAPTTAQSEAMGWPAPQYINIGQGDSDDPSIDNANYPYGGSNWFMQPGYLQG